MKATKKKARRRQRTTMLKTKREKKATKAALEFYGSHKKTNTAGRPENEKPSSGERRNV